MQFQYTAEQLEEIARLVETPAEARRVCQNLGVSPPDWLAAVVEMGAAERDRLAAYLKSGLLGAKADARDESVVITGTVRTEPGVITGWSVQPPDQDDAETETGGGAVTIIEVERLVDSPMQPRKCRDEAAMTALVESVREVGVRVPILVLPLPDGRYEILEGHRRVEAARMAGLATVPAVVIGRMSGDDEKRDFQVVANMLREDLAFPDLCRWVAERRKDLTQKQIANMLGVTQSWVSQVEKAIAELGLNRIEELWRQGVSAKAIVEMARCDDELRERWVEQAYSGEPPQASEIARSRRGEDEEASEEAAPPPVIESPPEVEVGIDAAVDEEAVTRFVEWLDWVRGRFGDGGVERAAVVRAIAEGRVSRSLVSDAINALIGLLDEAGA